MGLDKFIKLVKKSLNLNYEIEKKKKSLKLLLKKLRERKREIKEVLKTDLPKQTKKDLEEEKDIISMQIRKGKQILHRLYKDK